MDEATARGRRAEVIAKEIDTHRRAIEFHEAAVARFTELGYVERVEAARTRVTNAQKLLRQALGQARELLQQGYAAMSIGPDSDAVVHAVADGAATSMCGVETADMIGFAEHFASVPCERQCSSCVAAIDQHR